MKKLIQILAVSAGGGLLFGAGVRMAEKRQDSAGSPPELAADERMSLFLGRLESLEQRLQSLPGREEEQVTATESQSAVRNTDTDFRAEIAAQMRQLEDRLRRDLSEKNDERVRSLGDTLQFRLEQRLTPLETEITAQRISIEELKEYSQRTDRSLQKLLEGVDKLVAAQNSRFGTLS